MMQIPLTTQLSVDEASVNFGWSRDGKRIIVRHLADERTGDSLTPAEAFARIQPALSAGPATADALAAASGLAEPAASIFIAELLDHSTIEPVATLLNWSDETKRESSELIPAPDHITEGTLEWERSFLTLPELLALPEPPWCGWWIKPETCELELRDPDHFGVLVAVDLEECTDSARLLEWIMHVSEKDLAVEITAGFLRAVDSILNPAGRLCGFGQDKTITSEEVRAACEAAATKWPGRTSAAATGYR